MTMKPQLKDILVLIGSFLAGCVIGYFIARLQGMDALAATGDRSAGLVITLLGGLVCLRLAWRLRVGNGRR